VHKEKFVTLFLQPILLEHYIEGLLDLTIWKFLVQLNDEKLCRIPALALHGRDSSFKVLLAHKVSHSYHIISHVSSVSTTFYTITQTLRSIVQINDPFLGNRVGMVGYNITEKLKMDGLE
jgi:hypothetical protein